MRVISPDELVRRLSGLAQPEPRVVASGNFATPQHLLAAAESSWERYRLFMLNAQHPLPERHQVVYETPFVGPAMRGVDPRRHYFPVRLSLVPHLFSRSCPPDVVFLHTSAPESGQVSLGIEVNVLPGAIEQARATSGLVVAQINRNMPYTFGDGEIDTDLIDLAVEADQPLASPRAGSPGEVAAQIAERVAALVDDGATLQTGIGTIPDATLAALHRRRGLAVWSEMISDGVLQLERHGATDQGRSLVASFLCGSQDLYRWVDHNRRLRLLRTETTNDPALIARQPSMTSINTALQVDLFAQANASWVGGRIFSGFGGQTDFIVGAIHASGGQALIALPSWHAKTNTSTVVDCLDGPVTSFQHSALVSEQGCAHIFGQSQRAQARLIIDTVAHPDARSSLRKAASGLGLV